MSVDPTEEFPNGSDQQGAPEAPGDFVGLFEKSAGLLDFAFVEIESSHIGERSSVIGEVAKFLQLVETPFP